MTQFYSYLSYEIHQDASTTLAHIQTPPQFLIHKGFMSSLLTTIWDHICGCTQNYCCASDIYL